MKDAVKGFFDIIFGFIADMGGANVDNLVIEQNFITQGVTETLKFLGLIATGLTLVYFLMDINQRYAFEGSNFNLKSLLAPLLKLFFALCIALKGGTILTGAIGINNAIIKQIGDADWTAGWSDTLDYSTMNDAMVEMIDKFGILILVVLFLPALISFLLLSILKLVWWYKGLVYRVEFIWRTAIFPIAFADIYSGLNSNAIRYIKGFFAFGLYGAALCCLPKLAMMLSFEELEADFQAYASMDFGNITNVVDQVRTLLELMVSLIQAAFVAPFVGLSAASLARQAAKEALA